MTKNLTSHLRIATVHDAQAIAQTHISSWQKMYVEFIPEDILKNLSLTQRTHQWYDLLNQGVKILVIEIDGDMVGFASVCSFRGDNAEVGVGEISAIYLHPKYWRQGLGTELCSAALLELEKQGYKKVYLWVLEANAQARNFYEALGFAATDVTKLEEFYDGGALLKEILYQKNF